MGIYILFDPQFVGLWIGLCLVDGGRRERNWMMVRCMTCCCVLFRVDSGVDICPSIGDFRPC